MNILVKLEVSKQIGTGHFRRMFNLALFLKEFNFIFLISTDDKKNKLFQNINVIFIEDETHFRSTLLKLEFNLLIFDLLHYEKDYIKSIKSLRAMPIVCFHEYNDYSDYADLIINYNVLDKTITDKLFGYEYIIFSDNIEKYKSIKKENYIFVSFGGSDPSGLTQKFVSLIASKMSHLKFKIHIGDFNDLLCLKAFNNIEYIIKPENLFEYMSKANLAISAAGNMMYELIYMSVPSIIIAHNEHQMSFAKNAKLLGYVEFLGLFKDLNFDLLKQKIDSFYNLKEIKFKDTIDNNGKKRICKVLMDLINK
jgi:spore coat polysaccharide biosynthesis predicted glycosyltransferase SpsG